MNAYFQICTCCSKWLILRTLGIPRFGSSNKGIQTKGPYDPPKTPKSGQPTASPNTSPVTNRDSCNRWCNGCIVYLEDLSMTSRLGTLQGTNISHLGKKNIIFKSALEWDMLVPWRVFLFYHLESTSIMWVLFASATGVKIFRKIHRKGFFPRTSGKCIKLENMQQVLFSATMAGLKSKVHANQY